MAAIDSSQLNELLHAVGAYLEAQGERVALLVVGGAALSLHGWIERTTHDVDVLALVAKGQLLEPRLPEALVTAVRRAARDFGLDDDWLNAEVGAQRKTGLPDLDVSELTWLRFGALRIGLADRQTLITLKLFAAVDQGPRSVHTQDLIALDPTHDELDRSREWVVGQDIAPEFAAHVDEVIRHVHARH